MGENTPALSDNQWQAKNSHPPQSYKQSLLLKRMGSAHITPLRTLSCTRLTKVGGQKVTAATKAAVKGALLLLGQCFIAEKP